MIRRMDRYYAVAGGCMVNKVRTMPRMWCVSAGHNLSQDQKSSFGLFPRNNIQFILFCIHLF